jgi:hypothetical protein
MSVLNPVRRVAEMFQIGFRSLARKTTVPWLFWEGIHPVSGRCGNAGPGARGYRRGLVSRRGPVSGGLLQWNGSGGRGWPALPHPGDRSSAHHHGGLSDQESENPGGECTGGACGTPCQSGWFSFDLRERDEGQLPLLQPGADYNTDATILAQAQALATLGRELGVGELRLHTFFLRQESIYNPWPDQTSQLLQDLAATLGGRYHELAKSESIGFSGVNLGPLGP